MAAPVLESDWPSHSMATAASGKDEDMLSATDVRRPAMAAHPTGAEMRAMQERKGISDSHDVRLEPGKVRRWLEDRAPEQVCGTSNCWGRCPLATYLREAYDACDVRVGEHTYRMMLPKGDTGDCPLPDWATRFVDYVDAGPDLRQVTAAEALELLERAAPLRVGTDPEGAAGRSTPGEQMSTDAELLAPSAARSTICAAPGVGGWCGRGRSVQTVPARLGLARSEGGQTTPTAAG